MRKQNHQRRQQQEQQQQQHNKNSHFSNFLLTSHHNKGYDCTVQHINNGRDQIWSISKTVCLQVTAELRKGYKVLEVKMTTAKPPPYKTFLLRCFNPTRMVSNKIPENYDLRKVSEVLLDELSRNTAIDSMQVQRIIEKGNPNQAS